ncbi:MAG: hypothetical protein ABEK36_00290, partial [Candidatus Aenigmatarchaeota archaeon]
LYINMVDVNHISSVSIDSEIVVPIEYVFAQEEKLFTEVFKSPYVKIYNISKVIRNQRKNKFIDMGHEKEDVNLLDGWYDKETERDGTDFRWGGKINCSSFQINLNNSTNYNMFTNLSYPAFDGSLQKINFYINGIFIDTYNLENEDWNNVFFYVDNKFLNENSNTFEFCYEKLFSPKNYTNSSDDRELGTRFDYFNIIPDKGFKVLNIGSNAESYLVEGWHEKETENILKNKFRWGGNKNCSTVKIKLNEDMDYKIYFKATSLYHEDLGEKVLDIYFNDKKINNITILDRKWYTYDIRIDKKHINSRERDELKFCYNTLDKPKDFYDVNDTRSLGVAFDYIVFVPKEE